MKTIAIETETRPLAEWLPLDDSEEVVYLMKGGRAKFVIVPLAEPEDWDAELARVADVLLPLQRAA